MTKKIAIITGQIDIELGGAERSVGELADALAEMSYDVHILTAKGKAGRSNIHVLCADEPGDRTDYRLFADALKKHIGENHYDIIHSVLPFDFADIYQPRGGTYAETIIRNAVSYENKFIVGWKRATAVLNLRRNSLFRAEKRLCTLKDGPVIIAISNYVAGQFKNHYGIDGGKITVIPNGIKIKKTDNVEAGSLRAKIISHFGVPKDTNAVLFLFAANNFRLKGLGCLLKAMNLLKLLRTERPAFLIVAGSGNPKPYRRMAVKLNVSEKVIFYGNVSDIGNLLGACDIAVLPTFYDPCSRFILEALSVGNPVITTKFNGATELFVNDIHGRVLGSPDDISGLAQSLAFFTHKANVLKASLAIAQDNLKQRISITRVAGQLNEVYESINTRRENR